MNYENVLIEKKEKIGIITLNRPECLNSTNVYLAIELSDALEKFEKDDDVNVVIIKGAGKGFCSGVDVNALKGMFKF